MIVRVYDFQVIGLDGLSREWNVSGTMVDSFSPPDFPKLVGGILSEVFQKLTAGKAVFNNPGKGGCRGPYKYTKIVLELKEELEAS